MKIKERNDRVGGQRERKKEREAEEGGGGELAEAETEGSSAAKKPRGEAGDGSGGTEDGVRRGKVEVVQDGDGAVKIRNGRRVRVGPKVNPGLYLPVDSMPSCALPCPRSRRVTRPPHGDIKLTQSSSPESSRLPNARTL